MLHPVDQCFQIEGKVFGRTTGIVAGIFQSSFPALEQLDLDDDSEVIKQSWESHTVMTGTTSFTLHWNAGLHHKYGL
jgi:hypothetical protein